VIRKAETIRPATRAVDEPLGPGRILLNVLDLLDQEGIAYCIPHGYDGFLHDITADVDMVLPAEILPHRLVHLLHDNRDRLGARIVQWLADREHFIVLTGKNPDGSACFLQLHVGGDYVLQHRVIYTADAMLASARPHRQWRVPSPGVEYTCRLARRAAKGRLMEPDVRKLDALRMEDESGCDEQMRQVFGSSIGARVDQPADMRPILGDLRARMLRRATLRRPFSFARNLCGAAFRRAKRIFKLDRGLSVVFLGPDGSGKSTIVRAVAQDLAMVFAESDRQSFPPALRNRGKDMGTSSTPHDVKPRSFISSSIRALGYWFMWERFSHRFTVRRTKSRNGLVLHDRHIVDALVDPVRYRYGGPLWLLRAIWTLLPNPDLVILLDVPADIAYERKREVPVEEIARLRDGYARLVRAMPCGKVIDASKPLGEVIADVDNAIVDCLAQRVSRRFGLEA